MTTRGSLLMVAILLVGCASGTQIQAECEAKFSHFPDIYACTKSNITERSPQILQSARAKMYLLRGEQLAERVVSGKMTSLDAKVEWQKSFIALKNEADQDAARAAAAIGLATKAMFPQAQEQQRVKTSCETYAVGNSVRTDCR